MKIEVLGSGCPKCNNLLALAKESVNDLNIEGEITKVSKISEIMKYGVLMTPALVIDGKVKCSGKVPASADIKKWLQEK